MPSCAVITCRVRSQVSSVSQGGVSFHRFPKERRLREKWIKRTGREHWVPTRTSTICSRHFSEDDFILKASGNRFLVIGAVPCKKIVRMDSDFQTDIAAEGSLSSVEVKTERLEEPMSPTTSSNGDPDEPLRIGRLTTIAIDPLSPKHGSTSEVDSNASNYGDEKIKRINLRKKLKEKEKTCKEHVNKIESLLKANRRLCQQNKNLKRMLMTMKKKINILEGNERRSDDEGST